jgi:prepilin-type processing-associated H-X9-DG protein
MNAGMFAVQLVEKGFVDAQQLAVLLVCPAAPLADKVRAGEFAVQIPTMRQLAVMRRSELAQAQQRMSPFYAYHFPYQHGKRYVYRRDDRKSFTPILCDTSHSTPGEMTSPNHPRVVQVLFGDGHVRLFQSCLVPAIDDDLYRNARGAVAAGCGPSDAVLGRSEAVLPRIEFASQRRQ